MFGRINWKERVAYYMQREQDLEDQIKALKKQVRLMEERESKRILELEDRGDKVTEFIHEIDGTHNYLGQKAEEMQYKMDCIFKDLAGVKGHFDAIAAGWNQVGVPYPWDDAVREAQEK